MLAMIMHQVHIYLQDNTTAKQAWRYEMNPTSYSTAEVQQAKSHYMQEQLEEKATLPFDVVSIVYSDINALVTRINDLADKLCGAYSTDAKGGSRQHDSGGVSYGILNEMIARSEVIDQRIRSANESLARIERML